jgi:hypothetical protein
MTNLLNLLLYFGSLSYILCLTPDLKTSELDSSPVELIYCGAGRDNILIITETSSLYVSNNKGFSFKKLNDIITHTGKETLEENENEVNYFIIVDRKSFKNYSITNR